VVAPGFLVVVVAGFFVVVVAGFLVAVLVAGFLAAGALGFCCEKTRNGVSNNIMRNCFMNVRRSLKGFKYTRICFKWEDENSCVYTKFPPKSRRLKRSKPPIYYKRISYSTN